MRSGPPGWRRKAAGTAGLLIIMVVSGAMLFTAPAGAQVACVVTIGSANAAVASTPDRAIQVPADATLEISGASAEPAGFVRISLEFAPIRRTILESALPPGATVWRGTINVADYASEGVGLYRLVIESNACTVTGWVEVTGRSPLSTLTGGISLGALVLGLGLAVMGLVRAGLGRGGLPLTIGGAAVAGLSANVLTQQFGIAPVTGRSAALWVSIPGTVSGLGNAAIRRLSGVRRPTDGPILAEAPSEEPSIQDSIPMEAPADEPPTEGPILAEAPPEGPPTGAMAEPPTEAMAEPPTEVMAEPPTEPVGATMAEPPKAPDVRDPPRSFFALLDCPDVVVARQEFEIQVGLSPTADPRVATDTSAKPFERPAWSVGPYTVVIEVIAEGFDLRNGESWRQTIPITADDPYPAVRLHLTATDTADAIHPTAIRALYSIQGATLGMAVRPVAVVETPDLASAAVPPAAEVSEDLHAPTGREAPDLTIRILRSTSSDSALVWSLDVAPGLGVGVPTGPPLTSDIGEAPDAFARRLVAGVNARERKPGLYAYLRGVGRQIADQVPQPVLETLAAVGAAVAPRPPAVLLLSEEPYTPWELAVLDPPLDPKAPPFLAAQANVGRWVLGHRRPKVPPPNRVDVTAMAVVSGVYERPGWRRLQEAEAEADLMAKTYGAAKVDATVPAVLACIEGSPPANVVHFAVHGSYDPNGTLDGLIMVDGQPLDPFQVKGEDMPSPAFVFLNACQVGAGNRILGDYAGMAEAFLYAGAAGVIAPLWSIDDAVAKQIAVEFYEKTFGGATAADVLRSERAHFVQGGDGGGGEPLSATYLAYQYYGDPALRLGRVTGGGH